MGTKNQPGKFDCYSKLEPDEPHFVIMGRDPSAALVIGIWAMLREAEGKDAEKVEEARECADACLKYALDKGKHERVMGIEGAWQKYLELQAK